MKRSEVNAPAKKAFMALAVVDQLTAGPAIHFVVAQIVNGNVRAVLAETIGKHAIFRGGAFRSRIEFPLASTGRIDST